MIHRLKALFEGVGGRPQGASGGFGHDEFELASAALLVEAALMDGHFGSDERAAIQASLRNRFGLEARDADLLILEAEKAVAETNQLYAFTRTVKDRYGPADRVRMIEMLWSVVYADGKVHDFEANLVRRVAGLLYVSDRDSGLAKQRVLARREAVSI